MKFTKFSIKDYKCFARETFFDCPELVNLIIGKNNSGKSTFLDVIGNIYEKKTLNLNESFFCIIEKNDLDRINAIFEPRNNSERNPYYQLSLKPFDKTILIGKEIKFNYDKQNSGIDPEYQYVEYNGNRYKIYFQDINSNYLGLGNSKKIMIKAERNVVTEKYAKKEEVSPNGTGLTSILKYHYTDRDGSRELKDSIVDELNNILRNEEEFKDLRVLDERNGQTIFLENQHGEISLNDMGSGIKTLLLVLFWLKNEEKYKEDSFFMFEELENNLHPEIQRRLFNTIYDYAVRNNKRVFITSHSHVAINCFYGKENSKIFHIEKDSDGNSLIETVDSDLAKGVILDDLGVKASDLFQSNGIVWVEGPSDRIYLNKWLAIVAPELKEGIDFTYLLYGGKLLSHYDANQENDLISILLTNRNSVIVIDSDIKEEGGQINSTKKRIQKGFSENNKLCWITKGREIENYIRHDVVERRYKKDPKEKYSDIGIYEDFKDYIVNDDSSFESHKVQTAKELIFKDESLDILDLRDRVCELANEIKKWN